jgi:hypothetical protein
MKSFLLSCEILLVCALYLSSCNPIDEEEINSSPSFNSPASQQMSSQEVFQAIQGEWYCYRSISVDGPTCAGGSNETKQMTTYDLQYLGYKIAFTNTPSTTPAYYGVPLYQVYGNGGSSTSTYGIFSSSDHPEILENSNQSTAQTTYPINDGAIYLWGGGVSAQWIWLAQGGILYGSPARIVNLENDELVIRQFSGLNRLFFFKRSNSPVQPYNEAALQGTFLWDNHKVVSSGVEIENTVINQSISYTFSDEIHYNQNSKDIHYIGQRMGPMTGLYPSLIQDELQLDYYNNGAEGLFKFETSSTHLTTGTGTSAKIHLLTDTELILRSGGCLSYDEYHFSRIN